MYDESLSPDDYSVSSEISVTSEISLDTSSIYDSSYADSEIDYETISNQLDVIHSDLEHIGQGIDYIYVTALLLLAFLGVWTVLSKWYFGGV